MDVKGLWETIVAKEAYIRELAELYKEVIAPEIYEAMLVWEVEIGD